MLTEMCYPMTYVSFLSLLLLSMIQDVNDFPAERTYEALKFYDKGSQLQPNEEVEHVYDIKCPSAGNWHLRARSMFCEDDMKYSCLKHVLDKRYKERCRKPEGIVKGLKYVLQPNLHSSDCDPDKYQPFNFWTSENSDCVYLKSKCNEEGQVVHRIGNSSTDTTCRCDYRKGYAFVSTPINRYYCIPSEEDCSCYLPKCKFVSPDYECLPEPWDSVGNECPVNECNCNEERRKENLPFNNKDPESDSVHSYRTYSWIAVLVFIIKIVVMLGFVLRNITEEENNSVQQSNEQTSESYCQDENAEKGLIEKTNRRDISLIVAIDIGMCYSTYAYADLGDNRNIPLDIICNQVYNAEGKQLISSKTPTSIILNKDGNFVNFGFDAEADYADNVLQEEQEDHFIFINKFKTVLHERADVSENMLIKDLRGKEVRAIDVFTLSIKALRDHLMRQIEDEHKLHQGQIQWVLTVPAMWSRKACEFMQKSAEKAGIPSDQLLIYLELDAASIYFQSYMVHHQYWETFSDKYMIVGLGGETVDISVHGRLKYGKLHELGQASGWNLGGTVLDDNFLQIIMNIVGYDVFDYIKMHEPLSFLHLLREFDNSKRIIRKQQKININFPLSTFNEACNHICGKSFKELLEDSQYRGEISVVGDKIRMSRSIIDSHLANCIKQIIYKMSEVLQQVTETEVTTIVLVGGFAASFLVQDNIRNAFKEKSIVVLDDSDLFVVKGAVLLGNNPNLIPPRIPKKKSKKLLD